MSESKLVEISLAELVEENRVFSEYFKDCRDEYVVTDMLPMYTHIQKKLKPMIDKLSFYVDRELNNNKPLMLGFLEIRSYIFCPSSPVLRVEIKDLESCYNSPGLELDGRFIFWNQRSCMFDESESGWGNKTVESASPYQAITKRIWDKGESIRTVIDFKYSPRNIPK